ncbi:hypothetical protein BLNAU_24742 [Blattamonas nauphoetae]|uniref:Uncharacterized protein n=1 Tax=Blattamonas nauphoetae TaxID=2049346 RepID=A0ABQ9WLL3_9EUKA|nr:hypothetical protein BLNAU_24742 [Blattamonas nauphoetae]
MPHVTFRRLNASGFRVTQGHTHAKARRGGREQLVLPRRQGPLLQNRCVSSLKNIPRHPVKHKVRQRATKQKQCTLNDDIFRIPVGGHDDDDTDSLSEFSDADTMAEPHSLDLFTPVVAPVVLDIAHGRHQPPTAVPFENPLVPHSPTFLQNFAAPTLIDIASHNVNPAPPIAQPPEPRLIQTTKKELYNQMRASQRAKRRTDVCQYCEAGKKLERKQQTFAAQGREMTDGELADLNLYRQHKASVAQQRQFYHDTINKSTDHLLEFFNHTVNRNIVDENHHFVRHVPSPDTELFYTVTLKSLKECLTYERRDGDIFGAYVGQQAVRCSMKRKVLSKTHEVWAGERVTFERPAQDQTSHVT